MVCLQVLSSAAFVWTSFPPFCLLPVLYPFSSWSSVRPDEMLFLSMSPVSSSRVSHLNPKYYQVSLNCLWKGVTHSHGALGIAVAAVRSLRVETLLVLSSFLLPFASPLPPPHTFCSTSNPTNWLSLVVCYTVNHVAELEF